MSAPTYASAVSSSLSYNAPDFTPVLKHSYGTFVINYDTIIEKVFTITPEKPTILYSLYKSIYILHPERIAITADPHTNNPTDRLHISLTIKVADNGWTHTIHLYGKFNTGPNGIQWYSTDMDTACKIGKDVVIERIAEW
jgi:hypothetical protein